MDRAEKVTIAGVLIGLATLLVTATSKDFRCLIGLPCPPDAVVVVNPTERRGNDSVPTETDLPDASPAAVTTLALREVYHENVPQALVETLELVLGHGGRVRSVAVAPGGSWIVLHDQEEGVTHGGNVPPDLLRHLRHVISQGAQLDQVVFTPWGGGWLAVDNLGRLEQRGAPADLLTAIQGGNAEVRAVGISSAAWVLLRPQRGTLFSGILPERLRDLLRLEAVSPVSALAMSPGNGFVAVRRDGTWIGENVPLSLQRQLKGLDLTSRRVELVALSPENDGWVVIADPASAPRN
jgi:hypothetical protein